MVDSLRGTLISGFRMKKPDPSVSGAAQALIDHLRATFPNVPYDTIIAIATQHATDPRKCWDLVRLESNQPTWTDQATSSNATAGAREAASDRYYSASLQPQGSYVIRRTAGSPSPQLACVVRDTRSCTPPCGASVSTNPNSPSAAPLAHPIRPQSLAVRSVLQPNSPSPIAQRRPIPLNVMDGVVHSCPGTPTGVTSYGPRMPGGYAANIPAFTINYQSGGSQITLTPSPVPNQQNFVASNQTVGGRPVIYLTRTTSHGPSVAVDATNGAPSWQYDRRPSFADVEIAHNSSRQRWPSSSSNVPSYVEPLRVSVENLNDGIIASAGSGASTPGSFVAPERAASSFRASSPNIKIHLDPGGGAVISSDGGGTRIRPRVTFTPMVAIQQCYTRPTLTVSLGQPASQAPTFDPVASAKITASTHAQAEQGFLTYQRSRLDELKKAMVIANTQLQKLRTDVVSMEQDLERSATISEEAIISLHKETRDLQAEIQSMLLNAESGDHCEKPNDDSADEPSRKTGILPRGPSLTIRCTGISNEGPNNVETSKEDSGETDQWSCSLCTFLNHADLPICETCEMPRITDVDGWQIVYDLSPSVFQ